MELQNIEINYLKFSIFILQNYKKRELFQCHILRLEGGWQITVLLEDTTEGGCNNALADIAACSCKHNGVQLFHI